MFVDDIPVENAYFAVIIRSPVAKGTLVSISCPHLDEEYTIIKASDVPGKNSLFNGCLPLLAQDEVSYIGEPVALLVGPSIIKLEEYAAKCVVIIEETLPEFSIEDAYEAGDIFVRCEFESGYLPKAKGELVVEGHYETGIQEHWYSDPHGAIVISHSDGSFTIKTASQRPEDVCKEVAQVLGIETIAITLENADLGIHLDGKIWYPSVISSLAALAAFKIKHTVKLQLTREEDYLYSPKRTPSVIHMHSLLTFDGQILETDVLVKIGVGAAGVLGKEILDEVCHSLRTVYKTGKLTIEALAIKTNVPPTGPCAGFGSSLAAFALERHVSKISDILSEESSEWRVLHLKSKLRERFGGAKDDGCLPYDILNAVAKEANFKRKWAAYELLRERAGKEREQILPQRGIGISFSLAGRNSETLEEQDALTARFSAPAAACVIEIEIDRVNYEARIRGIWLHIACGRPSGTAKAELVLRRAVLAALGWTSTEKIKFIEGKITPPLCALYELLPPSETPDIHISFAYEDCLPACDEAKLGELPFGAVSSAYTQAISQAVNHHFERIPITGQDVWRVISLKKQEFEKKEEAMPEEVSADIAEEAETTPPF
ncbi:MAG: molybdopterin-dependent oxidoreductase [Spirochaetaceae bacterium]|jgi:CO/xanthine dehydrogenase Mo-binding subunit|nr:molybdopterin-dependent oxidoreductase [Spirochaetaceae bacterium]